MRISEITPEYQGKTLPGQALPSENSSQPMERLPEYQPKHSENLGEKKSGVIGKTLKNQDSRIKEEKLRHKNYKNTKIHKICLLKECHKGIEMNHLA